jgi:hypothetical protein
MKRCPYCGKIVWLWQEKVITNSLSNNKWFHDLCYWRKTMKDKNSGFEEVKI